MNEKPSKPWQCLNCRQVLGQVRRNSHGIRQLHLTGGGVVIVGLAYITCGECFTERCWVPGEEALQELIEKFREV